MTQIQPNAYQIGDIIVVISKFKTPTRLLDPHLVRASAWSYYSSCIWPIYRSVLDILRMKLPGASHDRSRAEHLCGQGFASDSRLRVRTVECGTSTVLWNVHPQRNTPIVLDILPALQHFSLSFSGPRHPSLYLPLLPSTAHPPLPAPSSIHLVAGTFVY